MAHQLHLKSLYSYDSELKQPCPRSVPPKIKTLLNSYILRHVSHVFQALVKAKSMVAELLKKKSSNKDSIYSIKFQRKKKKKNKFFNSIKMRFKWSASHVIPMTDVLGFDMSQHAYYDSTWSSMITPNDHQEENEATERQLSGYLRWLQERDLDASRSEYDDDGEIDRLAELFIASCHEKFRLEKEESYRRYQEMLARSL